MYHSEFRSFECLDVTFASSNNIRTLVIYRPPCSTVNGLSVNLFLDEFSSLLEDVVISTFDFLILRDFNFHIDDKDDIHTKQFMDIIEWFNCKQLVTHATHVYRPILDLVIVRDDLEDSFLNDLCVVDHAISDHSVINFCLNLTKPPRRKKVIVCRKIKRINLNSLNSDIIESNLMSDTSDCFLVKNYEHVLGSLLDKHAPMKRRTITIRPKAPWYNANITAAKRFRRQLERKWRSSKSLSDRAAFANQCKVGNNLIYESKQLYYNDLIEENSSNSKLLFKIVNKLLQKNTDRQYPKEHDNKSLANSFADYFTTKIEKIHDEIMLAKNLLVAPIIIEKSPTSVFDTFRQVTDSDVQKLLSISKMKSCLIDSAPSLVLKECNESLLPIYTRIINLSLQSAVMPEPLKIAMLDPLLKKVNADSDIFQNFRPVSNLKLLSKLVKRAVFVQLNDYLVENELHEVFQSAYKSFHSTETSLLRVQNDILQSLDKKQSVILVLLHLSAAFDTIGHEI